LPSPRTRRSAAAPAPATSPDLPGLERWPLDRFLPYERNARTHSDEQIAQLAASITEFGFVNPVLATSEGHVLAGHGRLRAAALAGLDSVPVLLLDHLTPTQRRAYLLADNKLALNAGWDVTLLQEEIIGLDLENFDIELLGWARSDLDAFLDPDAIDSDQGEWKEAGEGIPVEHQCPSCGYQWSGSSN
jgi:hypothetical protein